MLCHQGRGEGPRKFLCLIMGEGEGRGWGWRESNEHPFLNSSFHKAKSHSVFFLFSNFDFFAYIFKTL